MLPQPDAEHAGRRCRVREAIIRERQREGIAAAKEKGVYRGRKSPLTGGAGQHDPPAGR
jgi:DNA invertase Pin-like site-specific DNA recombinase